MTRFGHKLNYVINTFVKHTPDPHPRPKIPLGYVVYFCYKHSLAKGRLGSEGGGIYLKLNLITRYLAFDIIF